MKGGSDQSGLQTKEGRNGTPKREIHPYIKTVTEELEELGKGVEN